MHRKAECSREAAPTYMCTLHGQITIPPPPRTHTSIMSSCWEVNCLAKLSSFGVDGSRGTVHRTAPCPSLLQTFPPGPPQRTSMERTKKSTLPHHAKEGSGMHQTQRKEVLYWGGEWEVRLLVLCPQIAKEKRGGKVQGSWDLGMTK